MDLRGEIKKLKIDIIGLDLNKPKIKIKKTTGMHPVVLLFYNARHY